MNCEHELKIIYTCNVSSTASEVVRWCRKCGAVIVDGEYDHKISPGAVMKIELPSNISNCKHNGQTLGFVCCDCGVPIRPRATDLDLALCGYLPATMQQVEEYYSSYSEDKGTEVEIPKGCVIATCGHKLSESEGTGMPGIIKDLDKRGNPVISYVSLCTSCHKEYSSEGRLINEKQADKYMRGNNNV